MRTIEFGDASDPAAVAAFWRAYTGKRASRKKPPRASTPRAPRGEGGRHEALDQLARAGYTMTQEQNGEHWLVNPRSGAETPRRSSYAAAIDAALALLGR